LTASRYDILTQDRSPLERRTSMNIVIIGGGVAGLLAINLHRADAPCPRLSDDGMALVFELGRDVIESGWSPIPIFGKVCSCRPEALGDSHEFRYRRTPES
jgi:hypothetical protein